MNRKTWFTLGGGLAGAALWAGSFAANRAQQPVPPADRGKYVIETGTKAVVAPGATLTPDQLKAIADAYKTTPQPKLDLGKNKIERPTEVLLNFQRAVAAAAAKSAADEALAKARAADEARKPREIDLPKKAIEGPTEAVLAKARADAAAMADADKAFVNPKVPPGKVTWHDDFTAACAASKKSGKPVLLFQMMGKLDDKFC